uniref:Myb/SANT-like domain-containing protein n=1 Tax=Lactuca sativa TaxID=4236 RepID=A0A9R1WQ11_LACSA|nr:hypothetical protein LSAT_V11C100034190 [Lactuca sativa]
MRMQSFSVTVHLHLVVYAMNLILNVIFQIMDQNDLMLLIVKHICVWLKKKRGHIPDAHFNKLRWENLDKGMHEETYKLYDRLMRLETGIDGTRSLLDASPEWWDEKIKVDKDFSKFRAIDLSIYKTYYAHLFRDSVATGDYSMTSFQFLNDDEHEENMEGNEENEEINLGDDEPLFPSFLQSSSTKRKKFKDVSNNRSTKSKTSYLEEKLEVVLDSLSTKCTQTFPPTNPSPTLSDCMNIVVTFPCFNEGST